MKNWYFSAIQVDVVIAKRCFQLTRGLAAALWFDQAEDAELIHGGSSCTWSYDQTLH